MEKVFNLFVCFSLLFQIENYCNNWIYDLMIELNVLVFIMIEWPSRKYLIH